ncbi:MAG TPA: aldehyde dehydrogenase family protein [Micromonosporaceae bacterium]|nr:aldehyde dehydrogenase family protein [Micromonosporaceae bacterium]
MSLTTDAQPAATAGTPVIAEGELISTSPATGAEVGRFPVADAQAAREAVERARTAAEWWRRLGFDGRRERLLRWRTLMTRRMDEYLDLVHAENGKSRSDGLIEFILAIDHVAWSARNAKRVLRSRRVRSHVLLPEFAGRVEYQPYGVVGVIGPWNYPILTPMGSITYALAAGNAVVFKPSEYTPAVGNWYVERFAEVVPEQPVLQAIFGAGETGAHLVRSGVDKVAFTGSPRVGRAIMAACAETLTPVLIEGGGKDAMIVDADADVDAAAEAAVFGAMTNAGQACVSIERAYVAAPVYDEFVRRVVDRASRLKVGTEESADIGPITMPGQIDIIRRHIDDALSRGARAVLGGPEAVQPPLVMPTVLVDVPEDAAAVREETFGPTLTITRVADGEEALARVNASKYGLGGSVFGRARATSLARRMRAGMVSVNGALTFAGFPALPFGGVGESGFGRIHGDDGLREFARPKAIAKRRGPSLIPLASYDRKPRHIRMAERALRLLHGR